MVHGDDRGLKLPPKIAPIQVIIVPVLGQNDDATVLEVSRSVMADLRARGIRTEIDERDELRPGAKYYEWEAKGVPIRVEIGPRDIAAGTAAVVRRWVPKDRKTNVALGDVVAVIESGLEECQRELLRQAQNWMGDHTITVKSKDEFIEAIKGQVGFVRAGWCGVSSCESEIKAATRATTRNLPLSDQDRSELRDCIWCLKPATSTAYFGLAY